MSDGHNYFFSMSSDAYGENWERIFRPAVSYMDNHDALIPPDLLDDLGNIGALKTVSYYTRVLSRDIRRLYNGDIDTNAFTDNLSGYVERQLRRAWNEGMRANGFNPANDMTPEWEAVYQQAVVDEYEYIDRLADQIIEAKRAGKSIDPFLSRAELWANRYTEIVNRAMAETGLDELFEWELGATEKHCTEEDDPQYNCSDRAGLVKTGAEWKADVMPQSRLLGCNGYRCDCRLVKRGSRINMLFAPALNKPENQMLFAPALKGKDDTKPT